MIFDDKCDASVGSDIVVSAMSEKDTYVGIGGMGHSAAQFRNSIAAKVAAQRISDLQMVVPAQAYSATCSVYILIDKQIDK